MCPLQPPPPDLDSLFLHIEDVMDVSSRLLSLVDQEQLGAGDPLYLQTLCENLGDVPPLIGPSSLLSWTMMFGPWFLGPQPRGPPAAGVSEELSFVGVGCGRSRRLVEEVLADCFSSLAVFQAVPSSACHPTWRLRTESIWPTTAPSPRWRTSTSRRRSCGSRWSRSSRRPRTFLPV